MERPAVSLSRDRPTEPHGVLVYDGECPSCSAASTALRRLPGIGAISYHEEPAQRFLAAQFGDAPFALVFVDVNEERVYVGREAARELCDRAGLPVLVADIVGERYETVADAVRAVSGVDREPDPYHDVVPLAAAAREAFDDLADAAGNGPLISVD